MTHIFQQTLGLVFVLALSNSFGQMEKAEDLTPVKLEGEVMPRQAPPNLAADLFRAIADANIDRVNSLLAQGVDPNATLSHPAPADIVERFRDTNLEYYITNEQGLTPVMLAAALGYPEIIQVLIAHGANPFAKTKRHHTFALWLAGRAGHIEVMRILLAVKPGSDADRLRIHINLAEQKAYLWRDDHLEKTMPISSGRKKFPTRTGRFIVTDKYRDWKSTLYPAKMPHFLRLSCGDFGLHGGVLPGYPASHGCIRLLRQDAKELFSIIPIGTLVEIE